MYWLYHTDADSFGFTEYMPCTMLLAMPHRCVFPRVHGAYAMYFDLRYATKMRVPSGSRSICHVPCYLLCHTDACSLGFTEHMPCTMIYVMPHRCVFLRDHGAYTSCYVYVMPHRCMFLRVHGAYTSCRCPY